MLILLNGLKATEGMSFLDTRKLDDSDINYGSVVIYVTKVLNGDHQLLYASRNADTLSKANGCFIEWDPYQIANHIETCLKERFLYTCSECKY